MSFREVPASVTQALSAARRIDPGHVLFVTYRPGDAGAAWELHPFKRWLVLRTDDQTCISEGIACALLARAAWLGTGAVTAVPEHLVPRFRRVSDALAEALRTGAGTGEAAS